jgi:hypothetical protein
MNAVDAQFWPGGGDAARAPRGPLLLCGLALIIAGGYAATLVATEGEPLLVAPLIGALVGVAVFVRPILGLYILFGAAILFEQFEITGLDPLTARTHFFQTISRFSAVPIPLSASDLLVLMTLASWAMRRLVGGYAPTRAGPFGWAVAVWASAFVVGTAIGVSRGGGWDVSANIAEARAPLLYACGLYFLTANLVRERGQIVVLLWEFVLLVGVKALQGIGNYAEVRVNGPYWIEAVTAHEDVVFFDVAITLALVMAAVRARGRLFYVLLGLAPVILVSELVTTRRVGFAALAATLIVVTLMAAVDRPRATAILAALGAFAFVIYVGTFWDSRGVLAEPLRVVREVVDPYSISDRDRGSNYWRQIENANIAFTMRQLPLTGVGLGQEYFFQQEPPPLTSFVFWRHMTHNALLWMWLKAGPYGAFALWLLVAQVIMLGLNLYRRLDTPLLRAAAAFPVLVMVAQVVFSSVDLGLTANRTMSVFGVALGLAAPLSVWVTSQRELGRAPEVAVGNGPLPRPTPRWTPAPLGGRAPTVTG